MLLMEERKQVAEYGRKLISSGLTKGTGGNLSVMNRKEGLYAISPSGMDYFSVEPEDVVVMDLSGKVVEGPRKPSSEWELHRIFYSNREELNAIVHTHSVYCAALATNRESLPACSYLVALAGKDVRCAEYASFGTPELAKAAYEGMRDRNAVLLANHGLVAGGKDLGHAFQVAEQVEFCAQVYLKARSVGTPVILPEDEMERMAQRFGEYGQKK